MKAFQIKKKRKEADNYYEYYLEDNEGSAFWVHSPSNIESLSEQLFFFGEISRYEVSSVKKETIISSEEIFSGKARLKIIEISGALQKEGKGVIGNLHFDLPGLPGDIKVGDYFEVEYTGITF